MNESRRAWSGWAAVVIAAVGLVGLTAAPPAAASAHALQTVRALAGRPTRAAMTRETARTVEVGDTSEHFVPSGRSVTTKDGPLALTAVVGQRFPTADGYGQLVFFWRGRTFLGWDSIYESVSIVRVARWGAHTIRVTYAHYASGDAAYDPSLKPVSVDYRWRGGRLVASRTPPSLSFLDQSVEFEPAG